MSSFFAMPSALGWVAVIVMVGSAVVLLTVVPPAQGNLFSDGGRRTRFIAGVVFALSTLLLFVAGSDATRWGFLLLGVAVLAFAIPRQVRDTPAPPPTPEFTAPFVAAPASAVDEPAPVHDSVDPLQLAFPISFSVVAVDAIDKPVISDPAETIN